MQKDYWNISKKNFRAMGILSVISAVIFGLMLNNTYSFTDSSIVENLRTSLTYSEILFVVSFVIFLIIASLFSKHSQAAINLSYVYLGIALLYQVVSGFILSSPANGLSYKIIALLVLVYLFVNTYKASKQASNPVQTA